MRTVRFNWAVGGGIVWGLLTILMLAPPQARAQTQKVRVAITTFANNSTWSYWGDRLGEAAADELATQLVQTGQFSVIERRQLQDVLAEQDLGQMGVVNPATAAQLGQVLGVQLVLVGSITKFSIDTKSGGIGPFAASYSEAESAVDVRLVNTTTAEIMSVAEGEGEKRFGGAAYKDINFQQSFDAGLAQEALRPAVEQVVERLAAQAGELASLAPPPGMANVVGARDANVYIDRGQNYDIRVGQRFAVHRVVDEITDAYGNVLDRVTERVGTVEVTRVLSQSSVCRIVEGDAQEGDTVQEER